MVWPIKIVTNSVWPQKILQEDGSRPFFFFFFFFFNKKPNSYAIVVRSAKAKNYAENIQYHIFFIYGEQLSIFFYDGVAFITYYFCIYIFFYTILIWTNLLELKPSSGFRLNLRPFPTTYLQHIIAEVPF